MAEMYMLSYEELYFTKRGRRQVELWCSKTRLVGDAVVVQRLLAAAREKVADEDCPDV
jgi:hypothetical protein